MKLSNFIESEIVIFMNWAEDRTAISEVCQTCGYRTQLSKIDLSHFQILYFQQAPCDKRRVLAVMFLLMIFCGAGKKFLHIFAGIVACF